MLLAALAFVLLATALVLAGWSLLGRAPLHLAFQAGAALLLVLMTALDLAAIPWSRASLAWTLLPFVVGGVWRGWRGWRGWRQSGSLGGWGSGAALLAVLVFAFVAFRLWSTNPDFLYHWGIKGERFYLAGGLDTDYLTRPWNHHAHPGYPHLLPMLFAATAIAQGGWYEPWLLLWSPLALALAILPCRAALACAPSGRKLLPGSAVVLVVGATALFSIAHSLAGGPDLFLTLALLTAAPVLTRPSPQPGSMDGHRDGLTIAVAAAFAAGSKTEGVVLAGLLLLAFGIRSRPSLGSWKPWRRWAVLALPVVVVTGPWLFQGWRLGLLEEPNRGPFQWAHAAVILPELGRALLDPHWHGIAVVAVASLPLLLIQGRTRWLAAVAGTLLLFYVGTYFTARVGADFWVRSSFPRILVHGVPALLLGWGILAVQVLAGDAAFPSPLDEVEESDFPSPLEAAEDSAFPSPLDSPEASPLPSEGPPADLPP
jgi:hypothetical protein